MNHSVYRRRWVSLNVTEISCGQHLSCCVWQFDLSTELRKLTSTASLSSCRRSCSESHRTSWAQTHHNVRDEIIIFVIHNKLAFYFRPNIGSISQLTFNLTIRNTFILIYFIQYHSVVRLFLFGHLLVQTSSALVSFGVDLFVYTCHTVSYLIYVNKIDWLIDNQNKQDGQGRARREAARRRKSECKNQFRS